ncbi:Glucose-methanol-choline oxidoreductase, N-terminal [Penicillium italicum]|uniref:Glucose-methanol-choline oxidoreductase, N-terminal n=1 Tax=Penicillium italicum TaxID=40296 RepID=A0A0A2LAU6_PENIT|nr:Glucose-methanol-choline oxidoreductase, N-terminal [Penicillium italicum]
MATIGVGRSPRGVTELFGNSCGQPGVNSTYDYIVVGGGTAGNAIAARLALDPANYSVAVVEAGSFYEILNSNRTQVPGYDFYSALANFVGDSLESLTNFAGSFYEILNSNRTQVPGYDFYSALANFVGDSLESLTNFGLQTQPQTGYNDRQIMYVAGQTFGGRYVRTLYIGYQWEDVG